MLRKFLPFVLMSFWIASAAGAVGLDFVPNVGQDKDGSAFSTEIPGAHVAFRSTAVEYTFAVSHGLAQARMEMIGANPRPAIAGTGLLPGIVNVYTDTARFSKIPTYGGLRYKSVYPGIDLEIDGGSGSLKSTWVVAPQTDPARIRWRYEGFDHVGIDAEGNLTLTLPAEAGEEPRVVTETAPVAWQNVDGRRVPVEVRYREVKDGSLAFEVGAYDEAVALVIDPTLIYKKELNSLNVQTGDTITADAAGNVYLEGHTTLGSSYVTKLDAAAVRQWTTSFNREVHDVALGPNNLVHLIRISGSFILESYMTRLDNIDGSFVDEFSIGWASSYDYSIAVDAQGNSYIVGPGKLTKLDAAGARVYWTEFTGLRAVALDGSKPVVVGSVAGTDNGQNVYVAALDADGNIVHSRTFGESDYTTAATGIAVDAFGRVFVVGFTTSPDFPLVDPVDPLIDGDCEPQPCNYEGFIIQLSPDLGDLHFSTYFGGNGEDFVYDVAVGFDGTIFIAGSTATNAGGGFPLVEPIAPLMGGGDAFVAKLTFDETVGTYAIEYSTPLGDEDSDGGRGLALSGNAIYVTGYSYSNYIFLAKLHDGLLPSGDVVNINFQPEESEVPKGYLPDSGLPYDDRRNGWSYGWVPFGQSDVPPLEAYDFDMSSDQQFDTAVALAIAESTVTRWEIDLKKGRYMVRLVAGSPDTTGSTQASYWVQIYAEGVPLISALRSPDPGHQWLEGMANVEVTDGRLTLTMDSRSSEMFSLAFLEIGTAKAPNTPPTVAVTSPLGGQLNSGRPVTLHAQADDSNGQIAKVDFYVSGGARRRLLVGTDTTAPYSVNWGCPTYDIPCAPGVAAGTYTIEAVATDNEGASTGSAPVRIEVKPLQTERPEFKVELKVFLPYETVAIPTDPFSTQVVAKGDDRDWSSTSQEYRMAQQVTLVPSDALDEDGIKDEVNLAGRSVIYESGSSLNPETGRLTLQARSEPFTEANKGVPYMVDYGTLNADGAGAITAEPRPNDSTAKVWFKGHAEDLLFWPSCYIDWSIRVEVDATKPAAPVANVYGEHEGFPAFEIYIDGEPVYQWKPPANHTVAPLCLRGHFFQKVESGPIVLK